ncbi:MAG TPA: ABC transporter permease [Vicinamibacterales bacterium]
MTLRTFRWRLWGSVAKRSGDARLREEIQTHLDLLTAEHVANGLSPAEAQAAARRQFGGVEFAKEHSRDERGFPLIESWLQDTRFAMRQLRRNPSFAIAAILTLAIGIGGTTAIFSVLDLVAIRPLSYPNPDRLVVLEESLPNFGPFPVSAADTEFWRRESKSFNQISLIVSLLGNLTGQGEPERLQIGAATPGLLPLLGARPAIGRLLLDEEDVPGRDRVVVLSDALWKRRFNADRSIVGRKISIDGYPYEVVGVLAPGFHAPNVKHLINIPVNEMVLDMWKPLALTPEDRRPVGGYSYVAVAQLKAGVSLPAAREELAGVQSRLLQQVRGKGDLKTFIVPLQDQMASRSRGSLWLLLAAVSVVLLIACVNIANLQLARSVARMKEMTVREALGAGRSRIVRQLLVENLVLALIGGVAAMAVAFVAVRLIVAIGPADVPRLDEVSLDGRLLGFATLVSLASGLLIGLVPAWRVGRADLQASLKGRGDADAHASAARLRSMLVACEIGLSAACVIAGALLFQSFATLLQTHTGFVTDAVVTTAFNLAGPAYQDPQRRMALLDAVMDDVRALPSVRYVAVSTQLPLTGTGAMSATSVEGGTVPGMERPRADVRSITPDYFRAMEVPLKTGRTFEATDRDRNVTVLSEELARQAWPGQDPIGRRLRFGVDPRATLYEVIGTVGDVRGTSLDQPLTPTAYVPFPQRAQAIFTLMVKTERDPSVLISRVGSIVRAHEPEAPLGPFRTMDDVVDQSVAPRRFQLQLVAVFALLTALLSGLGVFGVMAYSVAQRRGEIGIRLALGIPPREILLRVLRDALQITAVGLAIAAPLAWLAGRFLRAFLYGVTPYDPLAITAAVAIIVVTALAAAAAPGFRASRVNPMVVLRHE